MMKQLFTFRKAALKSLFLLCVMSTACITLTAQFGPAPNGAPLGNNCGTSCPPCFSPDPTDNCICKYNKHAPNCIAYPCDDGDPCTANDVEFLDCEDEVCVPCQGELRAVTDVAVINVSSCGAIPCEAGQFRGDVEITFNYTPVVEDLIITGDIYFSYNEAFCERNGNTITISDRCFDGDGELVKLNVIFNDKLPCSNSRVKTITAPVCGSRNRIGQFNSTSTLTKNQGLTVAPNPANEEFMLSLSTSYTGIATVDIYDLSGKLQLSRTVDYNHTAVPFNIDELSNGIYMVRVTTGDTSLTERLIKSTF